MLRWHLCRCKLLKHVSGEELEPVLTTLFFQLTQSLSLHQLCLLAVRHTVYTARVTHITLVLFGVWFIDNFRRFCVTVVQTLVRQSSGSVNCREAAAGDTMGRRSLRSPERCKKDCWSTCWSTCSFTSPSPSPLPAPPPWCFKQKQLLSGEVLPAAFSQLTWTVSQTAAHSQGQEKDWGGGSRSWSHTDTG